MYDYLDFDFADLPETFEHTFNDVKYNFRLYYNTWADAFYLDIWDENDVIIVWGEKLVYGMPVWGTINDQRLPIVEMVPIDEDQAASTVDALTFPTTVRLSFTGVEYNNDVDIDANDLSLLDADELEDDTDDDPTNADIKPYGNDPTVGGGLT